MCIFCESENCTIQICLCSLRNLGATLIGPTQLCACMCVQLLKDNILFDENCDSRILYLEEKDEEIVQIFGRWG